MGIQLNISQTKTSSEEAFESMAAKGVFCLVPSQPLWLLQHPFLKQWGGRRVRLLRFCWARQGAAEQGAQGVIASTPSLGRPMKTRETQNHSASPMNSATFPATVTVPTSNPLPMHQGASLSCPVPGFNWPVLR